MATNHKTMRGKTINMDALRLQNEKTIALGNMNVNAAGDKLGKSGLVTQTSTQRVKEANSLHTMRPQDTPVKTGAKPAKVQKAVPQDVVEAEAILDEADEEATPVVKKKTSTRKKKAK